MALSVHQAEAEFPGVVLSDLPGSQLLGAKELRMTRKNDSPYNDKSVVRAEGDFLWQSAQSQPLSPGTNEWSWLFTAKQLGEKRIQITLPSVPNGVARLGMQTDLQSRYIQLTVNVTGPFGISDDLMWTIRLLGSTIGFLFTAPLLVALVTGKLGKDRRKQP
jgi:hypothetical protein